MDDRCLEMSMGSGRRDYNEPQECASLTSRLRAGFDGKRKTTLLKDFVGSKHVKEKIRQKKKNIFFIYIFWIERSDLCSKTVTFHSVVVQGNEIEVFFHYFSLFFSFKRGRINGASLYVYVDIRRQTILKKKKKSNKRGILI